jgi:hypothetical protein
MVEEVETGDVFRVAYLVSRGGRVVYGTPRNSDHLTC